MADNDIETIRIVDEPITSKLPEETVKPEARKEGVVEGEKVKLDTKIITKDGKEYIETHNLDGTTTLQERGFWDKLGEKVGLDTPDNEGLKKAQNKIRVKMNKFGFIFAEAEQAAYEKYKLNQLMKPEEIEAEKAEIVDDVNILMETRIKIVSAYGDVINIVMDVVSHVVTRAFRYYRRKGGKGVPDGSPDKPYPENDEGWEKLAKETGFTSQQLRDAANV